MAEDYECNDNVNKVAPRFQGLNRTYSSTAGSATAGEGVFTPPLRWLQIEGVCNPLTEAHRSPAVIRPHRSISEEMDGDKEQSSWCAREIVTFLEAAHRRLLAAG